MEYSNGNKVKMKKRAIYKWWQWIFFGRKSILYTKIVCQMHLNNWIFVHIIQSFTSNGCLSNNYVCLFLNRHFIGFEIKQNCENVQMTSHILSRDFSFDIEWNSMWSNQYPFEIQTKNLFDYLFG